MLKRIVWMLMPVLAATCTLPAQDRQKQKTDSVSILVQKKFNEKDVAGLYALTGDAFKKALSYETLLSFCNNNLFPLGEIKELSFEKEANGICKYKSVFSTVSLSLFLGLDKTDKIETFLFKPYVDDKAKKSQKVASSNPLVSRLDKEVDSAAQTYINLLQTTGLSIGILVNGKSYYYGYGETAKGNSQLPNEHNIYEIGSISKTFTATLLADAVEKGKVKLDDPVSKYFPDSIPALEYQGQPVTLKMLLQPQLRHSPHARLIFIHPTTIILTRIIVTRISIVFIRHSNWTANREQNTSIQIWQPLRWVLYWKKFIKKLTRI